MSQDTLKLIIEGIEYNFERQGELLEVTKRGSRTISKPGRT